MIDLKMLNLIIGIFEYEKIPYEPINDDIVLWKQCQGKSDPRGICGVYVMQARDSKPPLQKIIMTIYEAVEYINDIKNLH